MLSSVRLFAVALAAASAAGANGAACPPGFDRMAAFRAEGADWVTCEDLQTSGGAIVLLRDDASDAIWLSKSYEPYIQGADDDYYLGLGKHAVISARTDVLGEALLRTGEPSWAAVERAIPPMRYSGGDRKAGWQCSVYQAGGGVRTFVGSRGASVDATFSDQADDCTDNGFPRLQSYVMNLSAIANGEPPISDFNAYLDLEAIAEGLVGGHLPVVVFYFPIQTQNFSGFGGSRYWSMIAAPVADMKGAREQSVWFRYQQLRCAGAGRKPPCRVHGAVQYYDTYWFSQNPITSRWVRPERAANAERFYENLLNVYRYWEEALRAEGTVKLQLPPAANTNGTWLHQQAVHSLVRSMISRENTWHPRYGVLPGYGVSLQDGFQDTFTATATAALEWGANPYARGVIDNWLRFYVRADGMISYRAEELAQSARMLTIFALYVDYSGDEALLVEHFEKARALADWLLYRESLSLRWPQGDPRRGIPAGGDEGDGFVAHIDSYGATPLQHFYSTAANAARGFQDIGELWQRLGARTGRAEMNAHAEELLAAAPRLRAAMAASLNRTMVSTGNAAAPRCVPTSADPPSAEAGGLCQQQTWFRSYPELMYAGVLTRRQVDDVYLDLSLGDKPSLVTRPLTLGCTGYNNKQTTYIAYGFAFGLLQHDMIERFLLHWFAMSAHTYTRGTWTTPEATHPDRDVASTDYVAAGVLTATTYLKWALCFEEPESKTLWLAKATPREWLEPGQPAIVARKLPSRYGRVGLILHASLDQGGVYRISANLSLPASFVDASPPGGVKLRLRTPQSHAGRLLAVSMGGIRWAHFDAREETIQISATQISAKLLESAGAIVATFGPPSDDFFATVRVAVK